MCCISGSYDKQRLIKLVESGYHRSGHSFSITVIRNNVIQSLSRELVTVSPSELVDAINNTDCDDSDYILVHQQAPTTSARSLASVHPSYAKLSHCKTYLWHNGIIKDESIKFLRDLYNLDLTWDTALLHEAVHELVDYQEQATINEIFGGFACVYVTDKLPGLHLFRNTVCPLFLNKDLDISSIKRDDSFILLPDGKVHVVDLKSKSVSISTEFTSCESPYMFLSDLVRT